MSERIPGVDDLIGGQAVGRERDRLAGVHDALVAVDPLPELPSSLEWPPAIAARAVRAARLRRRRRRVALAAACGVVALGAASVGYVLSEPGASWHAVAMRATAAAPQARATLRIGDADDAGNWPMTLSVRGLPRLPAGGYYEMFLTEKGRVVGSCGTFRTTAGTTVVQLNDPYPLGEYSRWVIRREQRTGAPSRPLLTT